MLFWVLHGSLDEHCSPSVLKELYEGEQPLSDCARRCQDFLSHYALVGLPDGSFGVASKMTRIGDLVVVLCNDCRLHILRPSLKADQYGHKPPTYVEPLVGARLRDKLFKILRTGINRQWESAKDFDVLLAPYRSRVQKFSIA